MIVANKLNYKLPPVNYKLPPEGRTTNTQSRTPGVRKIDPLLDQVVLGLAFQHPRGVTRFVDHCVFLFANPQIFVAPLANRSSCRKLD